MPRQVPDLDEAPSTSGRRRFYEQALRASEQQQSPQGLVAMVLLEVDLAPGSDHLSERILRPVTTKLAAVLDRRLRSVDVLVRTADNELAVLLAQAHLGVAASFSERLRQPIEQALTDMHLATEIVVCMGIAANPPASVWRPDALIELADYRMQAARHRVSVTSPREWALEVDGESTPQDWADSEIWPATSEMNSNSGV
jgi:diguanylate cyclase (GGDEF)-like protein